MNLGKIIGHSASVLSAVGVSPSIRDVLLFPTMKPLEA